jgi:hypothetical protein
MLHEQVFSACIILHMNFCPFFGKYALLPGSCWTLGRKPRLYVGGTQRRTGNEQAASPAPGRVAYYPGDEHSCVNFFLLREILR